MDKYKIDVYKPADIAPVTRIFNYFIKNSFAAYPATLIENEDMKVIVESSPDLPRLVVKYEKGIVGVAFANKYHRADSFRETAMLGYFILPGHTGKGIGKLLLKKLEEECSEAGVTNLLVHISSKNEASVRFHQKYGFTECGRFKDIGEKFNERFDVIWMQKKIEAE